MPTINLEPHAYADIFPAMLPDEYDALVADIHQHGQQDAIVLFEGKILDGRHRYRALCDLSDAFTGKVFEPVIRNFAGTPEEALSYVYSVNLYRRHLTTTQRACVAVPIKKHLQEAIRPGGDKRSEDYHSGNISRMIDEQRPRDIAGKIVNVSGRTVDKAERIQEEAPDLFERMMAGEMPINAAETALAVRNGTQTQAQAVKAVASEIVAGMGFQSLTDEKLDRVARFLSDDEETEKTAHVSHNSGVEEWYTPPAFIEAARRVMGGIDLDPASSAVAQKVVQASRFFTVDDDGLSQQWAGRVWMNPPYTGGVIEKFTSKLAQHFQAGDIAEAVVLVNNATETEWFQCLTRIASIICFPASRIKFLAQDGVKNTPLQGQAFLYIGAQPEKFVSIFQQFGLCVEVLQ